MTACKDGGGLRVDIQLIRRMSANQVREDATDNSFLKSGEVLCRKYSNIHSACRYSHDFFRHSHYFLAIPFLCVCVHKRARLTVC